MDDVCDQGPMHCVNQAERISRMEAQIKEALELLSKVSPYSNESDFRRFKDRQSAALNAALLDLQEETVTEPAKPMDVKWQCWESEGMEVKRWDPAQQEHLEACTSEERSRRIMRLPNLSGPLKEDDEVLCGGLFGWYLCRIKHENGLHAENESSYFPIKWGERSKCWVCSVQINKACFNRIDIPIPPGAKEEDRETSPADITASVRSELEGHHRLVCPSCKRRLSHLDVTGVSYLNVNGVCMGCNGRRGIV